MDFTYDDCGTHSDLLDISSYWFVGERARVATFRARVTET
eukprot:CAMPEP_0116890008 /NCGR_PEP_ID=MMETSP0467-20121206/555_1 /TAXON_ID=283647 /ORGANISM="Mesodinium pulex, Strain SPMC105" /LENGTH=39 /DNA_ID= /DNA_START= /DNA_END= /DNA_ORIENTATION=